MLKLLSSILPNRMMTSLLILPILIFPNVINADEGVTDLGKLLELDSLERQSRIEQLVVPKSPHNIEDFTCLNTPDSLREEYEKRPQYFRYGASLGVLKNGKFSTATFVFADQGKCDGNRCLASFFQEESGKDCEYVFSAMINRITEIGSCLVRSNPDKMTEDCEIYFNGRCFKVWNETWHDKARRFLQ